MATGACKVQAEHYCTCFFLIVNNDQMEASGLLVCYDSSKVLFSRDDRKVHRGRGSHPTTWRVSNTANLVRLPPVGRHPSPKPALTMAGRCQGLGANKHNLHPHPTARSVVSSRAVRLLAPGATVEAASRLELIGRIWHVMHL